MADRKITEFTAATTVVGADIIPVVTDVAGTPANKKITIAGLFGKVAANTVINGTFTANTTSIRVSTASTPANSTTSGTHGTIKWDSSYIYVCTANNVWKRVSLSAF